jgi:uncharacterized protein
MQRRSALQLGLITVTAGGASACGGFSESAQPTPIPPGGYGISLEKNVSIPMRDGATLKADVFRPNAQGRFPVIMSLGPYPKDIPFRQWAPTDYERQEVKSGVGDKDFMHWETSLPDFWVPQGYVQIRVDQRGSGASEGKLDILGPEIQQDFVQAIEWAGVQSWSNGRVGLLGDSYFAAIQWLVAQHRPRHLAAILPVAGFTDMYRDAVRHGGVLSSNFLDGWYQRRIAFGQYGAATNPASPRLTAQQLAANTAFDKDFRQIYRDKLLADDQFYKERTPDLSKINVPVYAHANGGGIGLHARGTVEGFVNSTNAPYKRLTIGVGRDPDTMYKRSELAEQQKFFDRFLKGERNGLENESPVLVRVRRGAELIERRGQSYPLAGTSPRVLQLNMQTRSLEEQLGAVGSLSYRSAYGAGAEVVRFNTAPLTQDLELIGPLRLRLTLSASAADADLFIAVREYRPDGTEVTAVGANNPSIPVSMGWLRASLRKPDAGRSTVWRTWHTYDQIQPLNPGQKVRLDVNIWPTAWMIQKGHTLALEISGSEQRGMDLFTHPASGPWRSAQNELVPNGHSPACDVTLYSGAGDVSELTMPAYQAKA